MGGASVYVSTEKSEVFSPFFVSFVEYLAVSERSIFLLLFHGPLGDEVQKFP